MSTGKNNDELGEAGLREKRLEEQLALAKLREKELRHLIDMVPAYVYSVDEEGRVLLANKAFAGIFGKKSSDLTGRLITEIDPNQDQAQRMLDECREAIKGGSSPDDRMEEILDPNGQPVVVRSTTIPYQDPHTGYPIILGVSVDVTELVQLRKHSERSRHAVVFGLARLAEARDGETGAHLERVCSYVQLLARKLTETNREIDDQWIETVTVAAALHDVGKVGIPDAVLLKPGPFTPEERRIMQRHTYVGGDTLLDVKREWRDDLFITIAAQIALSHHERWDGSGYPYGLKGENIPLAARIVALADVYDALTTKRVYKDAMTHEQARRIISDEVGAHFDPSVVNAFERIEGAFLTVARGNVPSSRG